MSNMPDINKKQLGVSIPLDLFARLRKAATDKGLTASELAQIALQREYGKYPITSAELFWIAEQTKKNEEKRKAR
ncbi:MAG: hypothetical protein IKO43_05255 [Kiritimatiellae bacterium]|nr:hypothetical protein [Kiritimatiellia bacterium]